MTALRICCHPDQCAHTLRWIHQQAVRECKSYAPGTFQFLKDDLLVRQRQISVPRTETRSQIQSPVVCRYLFTDPFLKDIAVRLDTGCTACLRDRRLCHVQYLIFLQELVRLKSQCRSDQDHITALGKVRRQIPALKSDRSLLSDRKSVV